MIRVRDLKKVYQTRFGENLVFSDISFDLAMGERLGILGRNGAGKSTLVRLISGAERPTAGTIESDISISWPLAFSGAFQPQLTGIDNVRFISRVYDQDFARNLAFVEEFAELGPYLREPVMTYSSGMRARLAFAISMIIEFDCFLIDEVGAVGDARFHERCNFELFGKRADRAMIIISHDASYIRDHCNRFAVLHDARLTLFDDFDAAFSFYGMQIGLGESAPELEVPQTFALRRVALDNLRRLALADDRFRIRVQQGDWARDGRNWDEAFGHYGAALSLHPYERSYWVQLGHVAREGGRFAIAECAYRSAVACGEPAPEVAEFLKRMLAAQNPAIDPGQVHTSGHGPLPQQPPAYPDLALLAALCFGTPELAVEEAATLLRECPTLDDLARRLLSDRRARRWLTQGKAALPAQIALVPQEPAQCRDWLPLLWRLIGPPLEREDLGNSSFTPSGTAGLAAALSAQHAFAAWPAANHALQVIVSKMISPSTIRSRSMEKNHG